MYQGAVLAGPIGVPKGSPISTGLLCAVQNGPLADSGPILEFTLTRLAAGDDTLEFSADEPLRTTFFDDGLPLLADTSATLGVFFVGPPTVLEVYDFDSSGWIEREEAVQAVTDYLLQIPGPLGRPPIIEEVIEVVTAYLLRLPAV